MAGKDWIEDFSHENGNYSCTCCLCHSDFKGHKRRVVCKDCDSNSFTKNKEDELNKPKEEIKNHIDTDGKDIFGV